MVRQKLRIRFRKFGLLRYISHQDLLRTWERLLRRTGLPLRFSEGFHPHLLLSSPLSLAVGLVGLDEVLEIGLESDVSVEDANGLIEAQLVEGLALNSVTKHAANERIKVVAVEYSCPIPSNADLSDLSDRISRLLDAKEWIIERKRPGKPIRSVNIRPLLDRVEVREDTLAWQVFVLETGTIRPDELLQSLGLQDWLEQGSVMTRSRVELQYPTKNRTPLTQRTGI